MLIDNKHEIGDKVYLCTDNDQYERIVTRIIVTPNGLKYQLTVGTYETTHYNIEIATERNILLITK